MKMEPNMTRARRERSALNLQRIKKDAQLVVRLPSDDAKKVKAIAKRRGVLPADVLRAAISEYIVLEKQAA